MSELGIASYLAMAQAWKPIGSSGYRGSDVPRLNASKKRKHKRKMVQTSRRANR